jgi:hypothetical protein
MAITSSDRRLPKFFDPKQAGKDLLEIKQKLVKQESEHIVARWFQGTDDVDLFIWENDVGQVLRQQLAFAGVIVDWNIMDGLSTGYVPVSEEPACAIKESQLIYYDDKPNAELIKVAIDILHHALKIDTKLRKKITANFS